MVGLNVGQPRCLRLAALLAVLLFISPHAIAVAQSKASSDTQPLGLSLEGKRHSPAAVERRIQHKVELKAALRVEPIAATPPPLLLDPPPPSTVPPTGALPEPAASDGAAVHQCGQPSRCSCEADTSSAAKAQCGPGIDPEAVLDGSPRHSAETCASVACTRPRSTGSELTASEVTELTKKSSVPSRDAARRHARDRESAAEHGPGSGPGPDAATGGGAARVRPPTSGDGGSASIKPHRDRQLQQWATEQVLEDWEVRPAQRRHALHL